MGIGTSPAAKLDVYGTVNISGGGQFKVNTANWPSSVVGNTAGRHIIGGTATPVLMLWNEGSVAANNESTLILGAKNAMGATYIGGAYLRGAIENNSDGAGCLSFLVTNTGSSFIERMRINSSGYVGIGTTTPAQMLSVNGNIAAKKIIVTQTGWSDYVFDEGYKLRNLSSLESFIKQNKHLPEVPSAKEVEAKGVNVGDNQALLLKKIEELMLYLIQQDRKINQVIIENKKLKQAMKSIK